MGRKDTVAAAGSGGRTGGRRYAKFVKLLEGKLAREKGAHDDDDAAAAESPGPRA